MCATVVESFPYMTHFVKSIEKESERGEAVKRNIRVGKIRCEKDIKIDV